jgi:hypothetical protein
MAHQKGSTSVTGIGFETTFKTTATTGFLMPVNSNTIKGSAARNTVSTLTGNRNSVMPYKGNLDVSGDIVVPIDNVAFGYWLKAMFGAPTTTGASAPYSHVFKIGDTQPSLTIQKGFKDFTTDAFYKAIGLKVSSFSIEVGGDGELTATLSFLGCSETSASSTCFTVSETTVPVTLRYNNFDASITEGGSTASNIKSLSLNIDFDLDGEQRLIGGQGARGSLPEGIVKVTGNVKGMYDDASVTTIAKGFNDTESSLVLTLTPASPNDTYTLIFDIGELLYSQKSPEIAGPQGIDFDLDFVGYYDNDADASVIKVTLNSSEDSYA